MKNHFEPLVCSGLILIVSIMLLHSTAWSAEPSKVLRLEEITVRGKSGSVSPPPPSATIIDGEDLIDDYFDKPLFIMQKIPGVAVRDYGQGAVASQFTMRGLRLGHNTGAALFIDGVPINESTSHGDGYADYNLLIPEDIDYVEVIKGPSSALYGQFARAGVINIVTRHRGNFSHYKFGFGNWDRQRFAMSTGREEGKMNTVFGLELSRSEGATQNSEWFKGNATAKITYDFNDRMVGSLAFNFNATEWDHPEYLTEDQWNAGEYWSALPLGGGKRHRYGMSSNLTYDITDDDFINFMLYGYTSNLTRYRDKETRVDEEYHDRDIYGGSISYLKNSVFAGMNNALTVGMDGQVELTNTIKAQNPSRIQNAREIITVDGDSTLNTFSVFFQDQLSPAKSWKITLGGRYDHMGGDLDDRLIDQETSMEEYDIFSPKAGIEYMPLEGYTFFTTYGEGFRLPSGLDKFYYPDLTEETYKQYEAGVKLSAIKNLVATVTGFVLDVDNEIVTDAAEGTKVNQGETRRKGVELEMDYIPIRNLQFYGNVSYTDGEYKHYINNGVDYSGSGIELVSKWLYSFGARWRPSQGFYAGFDYRYVGDADKEAYAVDFTGTRRKTMDYWVADAQIGYRYNTYSLSLDVTNIFDERYPSYESASSYRTANPRGAFLTLSMSY
ncbi:MAG: TonB-dependent receptor [Desulfobacteraceae bacterium]|jgi:outer membrane receptor protein involved in Fe transport